MVMPCLSAKRVEMGAHISDTLISQNTIISYLKHISQIRLYLNMLFSGKISYLKSISQIRTYISIIQKVNISYQNFISQTEVQYLK